MPAIGAYNHITGLLAKVQAAYDTAETLSASTDGCDVYIGDGEPPPPEQIDEVFNGSSTSGRGAGTMVPRRAMAPLGFSRQVTYQQRLKGSLVPYSVSSFPPNEIHRFLLGCGLDATFSASPNPQWLYTPVAPNAANAMLTLADFRQQDRYDLRNAVGTLRIESTDGGAALISFEMRGIADVSDPTNTAMPAITIGAHGVMPPHNAGCALKIGGIAFEGVLRRYLFTQNLNWDSTRTGINLAGLHGGWARGGHAPTLELEFERTVRSVYNPEAIRKAGTSQAIELQVGPTQYNRFTLALPQAQISAPVQPGNDGSKATMVVTYGAHTSTPYANDAFSLLLN